MTLPIDSDTVGIYSNFLRSLYVTAQIYDPQELKIANILRAFDMQVKKDEEIKHMLLVTDVESMKESQKLEKIADVITGVANVLKKQKNKGSSVEESKALGEALTKFREFDNFPLSTQKAIDASRRIFMGRPRIFFSRIYRGLRNKTRLKMNENERLDLIEGSLLLEKETEKTISRAIRKGSRVDQTQAEVRNRHIELIGDLNPPSKGGVKYQLRSFDYVHQKLIPLIAKRIYSVDWSKQSETVRIAKRKQIEKDAMFRVQPTTRKDEEALNRAKTSLLEGTQSVEEVLRTFIQTILPGDTEDVVRSFPKATIAVCALLAESAKVSEPAFVQLVGYLKQYFGLELHNMQEEPQRTIQAYLECSLDTAHLNILKESGLLRAAKG